MSVVEISEYGPAINPIAIVGEAVDSVGAVQSIEVSVDKLQAALECASTDETRYYLRGVFIHRTSDGFVRAVSTDGHRMLVTDLYREFADQPGPAWLDAGVIVPAELLKARLAIISKTHGKAAFPAKLSYATNGARVEISDAMGENVFRLKPVDGQFPNYADIIGGWSSEDEARGDWSPIGFDAKYLKSVGDLAAKLGSKSVACFASKRDAKTGNEGPVLFTFGGVGGVALFLMPTKTDAQVAIQNRDMLAPAIKSSIAALRAHETRNRKAAKKLSGAEKEAAITRADDFKARIEALMVKVGDGTVPAALPAPPPPAQIEQRPRDDIADALAADAYLGPEPVEEDPVAETPVEDPAPKATKTTKAKKVRRGAKS